MRFWKDSCESFILYLTRLVLEISNNGITIWYVNCLQLVHLRHCFEIVFGHWFDIIIYSSVDYMKLFRSEKNYYGVKYWKIAKNNDTLHVEAVISS